MAVTFVAAGTLATDTTVGTVTVTAPACNADDILIACIIHKALGANISPPDGTWTSIIFGDNDCTTAADDHSYAVFWKRATGSGGSFAFANDVDDNLLLAGVISAWRGCPTAGDPLDATAASANETVGAADDVTFNAFDPTSTDSHIIFIAFYGNDLTTFAAAMSSDTNPDCTTRFDLETNAGTDCTIACTSGDTTDGSNIASRTWASGSTTDAGSTGVVFGLKVATVAAAPFPYMGGGYFPVEG